MPRTFSVTAQDYVKSEKEANFLLQSVTSGIGTVFGPYFASARFNHTGTISRNETFNANAPWGTSNATTFWYAPYPYSVAGLDKTLIGKFPYLFEYTDIVARVGYIKTVCVPFIADEILLVRAEANIILKNYASAVQDLNIWTSAFLRVGNTFTQNELETFYENLQYSTDNAITQKKRLSPKFNIEAGTQENLLHCVLQYRRLLTLHEGMRWFDIRRYGIEVPRVQIQSAGNREVKDRLSVNDLRRTLQIPDDAIKAGITPNPR